MPACGTCMSCKAKKACSANKPKPVGGPPETSATSSSRPSRTKRSTSTSTHAAVGTLEATRLEQYRAKKKKKSEAGSLLPQTTHNANPRDIRGYFGVNVSTKRKEQVPPPPWMAQKGMNFLLGASIQLPRVLQGNAVTFTPAVYQQRQTLAS